MDLGVCVEAIRRAIVYGKDILKFREHPRKMNKSTARIATEGFLVAMKAIAENCPLPEYKKREFLERFERFKDSPWETVAKYGLTEYEIWNVIDTALMELRAEFGFEPEKYEKYLELMSEI